MLFPGQTVAFCNTMDVDGKPHYFHSDGCIYAKYPWIKGLLPCGHEDTKKRDSEYEQWLDANWCSCENPRPGEYDGHSVRCTLCNKLLQTG